MFDGGWADDLDDAQLAAAEHGPGPLVIVAGAGTGKTRTLTARVARLLESGVAAERVLLLTFTRRAAASMTSRAAALCGDPQAGRRLWGGTFHAIAHRLVAEHAAHFGLPAVTVLDPGDVVDLLDLLREEHGLTGTQVRLPTSQALADVYSRAINTGRPAREVMDTEFPWCVDHADQIVGLFRAFMTRKRQRGLLDFDDLLLCWRALLTDPIVGPRLQARWDWVLVDEYQDVNQVQVDIVTALRPAGAGLTVVGDDAQAIYGFRGASGAHLHELHSALPDSTLVRLQRNFRSTQPVLDLANVIRPGEGVMRLQLTADRDARAGRPMLMRCEDADSEARLVAEAILAAQQNGLALREQAVLMRAAGHSKSLEVELTVRKIPYVKYGGIRFADTAHVRDLLAGLRLAGNPHDELAWYRLLCRHRAIGKASARTLVPLLLDSDDGADYDTVVAAAPPKARTNLATTLAHLRQAQSATATAEIVEECLAAVRPLVRSHYIDWIGRAEDIDRLAATAATRSDLAAFVAEMTLDPASSSADYAKDPHRDEDYLTLSTVHSAKGLEWTAVHLIHAVDGAFPSDMALGDETGLEEEQRLFYVAVTRARDSLSIYTPLRMPTHPTNFHARQVIAKASRFLSDEARAVLDQRETRPEPRAGDASAVATRIEIPAMDELFS
ncbi:MAG: ATP-dependent helicase UvrD/PcrA [Pseudonocardiales bacterium]|jgi:DNA helicase-2/ATP-dependent DNA helicase PcrA|nr:ATP-dependent helicase UvrD/PcrA [Pseudonocardiales bacterium]